MRSLLGRFHRPNARSQSERLFMLNNLGDGSTLSLDFTTGVLDPRLTFTRSTTATYINSQGYVTTMAAAPTNDPTKARFDYDPTTTPPTPRGLLIEGSASNLVKYSQDLNQVSGVNQWYGAAFNTPTVPGSPPTDPFGGTTASWKLVATAGSAYHVWRFSATYTAADYTFSFWARAAEYDRIVLSDVGTGRGGCRFVLTGNGTATVISGGVTPTNPRITPYPGGWYRCEVTMTMTAALYGIGIAGYPSATTPDAFGASYNADGTSGVFATAVQAELGSGASSYIPTVASTGNRAYDHCYATGANFTSWFSTGAGTLVAVSNNTKNNTQNLNATISDDSTSNYVRMGFKVGGSSNEYLLTTVGGPSSFQGAVDSGYAPALNTVYKMAYAWDTNNFAIVANGGAAGTDTSGTLAGAGVLTRMVIGGDFVAVPNDIYFKNGHIRSLKYWPTRLSNAQLQALTT